MAKEIGFEKKAGYLVALLALAGCYEPETESATTQPIPMEETTESQSEDESSDSGPPATPMEQEGSSSGEPLGNLPCEGCAGDVCEQNGECLDGFICARMNSDIAWCSNCTSLGDCQSICSSDVNCGEGGVCHDGRCWHGCAGDGDCPDGHGCLDAGTHQFCAPIELPDLDEECIQSAAGWCESFVLGDGTCVYTGTDPQTDPGENWCTKGCSANSDCTDVWPLGCCSADDVFGEGGGNYCLRPELADFCMP